ncbi:MAG: trigger factor [Bacteroidota bacterium]
MNITLEKTDAVNASLKVKLEESDYRPKVGEKLKEYSRKAVVKGFRPGKVPASLIQKMYGKGVLVEEINALLGKSVNEYIKEQKLNLVGEPMPDVASDIDWDNQKEFEFSYTLGLAPDFSVDLSFPVANYQIELSDKEVNETIANLQKQYPRHTHPETSEAEDKISGLLKQKEGDLNVPVSIQVNEVNADAQALFIGLSKDSTLTFELSKVFADTEAIAKITGVPEEKVAELTGEFELTVEEIHRNLDAPLDQEFFDSILGKDAATNEEDFLTKVREIMSDNYQRETEALLQRDIQEKLVNQNSFALPNEFLKKWLLASNEGKITAEQVEQEYDVYARELRWNLIKNKIAEENDLKVEHEEVMERTKNLIGQQFGLSGMGGMDEAMASTMDTFANNFLKAEKGKNYMNIFNQVFADKVIGLVKSKLVLEKTPVEVEEFKKLAAAQ